MRYVEILCCFVYFNDANFLNLFVHFPCLGSLEFFAKYVAVHLAVLKHVRPRRCHFRCESQKPKAR